MRKISFGLEKDIKQLRAESSRLDMAQCLKKKSKKSELRARKGNETAQFDKVEGLKKEKASSRLEKKNQTTQS